MKIAGVEVLRTATVLSIIVIFSVGPIFGFIYGTASALTFMGFTVISPLVWALATLGTKTILVNLIVPVLTVILIIVFLGRFFCGWICPAGIVLEHSHIILDKKMKKPTSPLRKNRMKYVILLSILTASLFFNFTAPYLFSPPGIIYRTIFYFALQGILSVDLAVLLLVFILDIFALYYGRSWCNTICPLGTVITSLSLVNFLKPKVDREKCIGNSSNCSTCETTCPMRIPIKDADNWAFMSCSKCLKCWAKCPAKAIHIKVFS